MLLAMNPIDMLVDTIAQQGARGSLAAAFLPDRQVRIAGCCEPLVCVRDRADPCRTRRSDPE